jgi:hypothetical protein
MKRFFQIAMVAEFVLIELWPVVPADGQGVETQTFDSEASAASAGWLANDEGQNPQRDCTDCVTDLGWKNSNHAGAKAGEGGGLLHRSGSLPVGFYADTTIGELTLEQPIVASGKVALVDIDFDGHVQFGFFDARRLLNDPLDYGAEMGFRFAEPGAIAPNFRWGYTFSDDTGTNTGINNAHVNGLPDSEPIDFSIEYKPEDGGGLLTLTIGDEPPLEVPLSPDQRAAGATFTGFGVFTGVHHQNPDARSMEIFLDDLTYTSAAGGGVPLQPGDADMDLDFDQLDLVRVQIAAKYLTGQAATWGEGDWDGAPGGSPGNPPPGNARFDQLDIIAALSAGRYLRGPYGAIRPGGTPADGQTSVGYNPNTGEVFVDAPAGKELTSINIDSAAAIFTGAPAQNLGGSFDNDRDNNIFKATFGSSFGSLSFGNVAQPSLSREQLLNDLTVVGSLAGGGALGDVDLIYVPEPSAVVLLCLGLGSVVRGLWSVGRGG